MSLLPFFEWCENTAIGEAIRNSLWLFPVIEAFHLLALALIGGAVLLVNMRLLGLVMEDRPVSELARDAHPWFVGGLLVMLASGVPLFLSESIKCYYSVPFWVKMSSLLVVLVFTFTVYRRVTLADDDRIGAVRGKLVALVSLVLWSAVGWGGRWIGFS
jgi:uncharacterized membrane protein YhdT